jgi:glycosyltransferase 2 family protein
VLGASWQEASLALYFRLKTVDSAEAPLLKLTRKHTRGILQVTVSVVLLAVALRQVHWSDLRAALSTVQPAWLALAFALFVLGVFVRARRWQVLLNALGVKRPFRELSLWYFVGGFFNVMLPTGFGGDAVRVIEVSEDSGRTGAVVNSVVVDRYLGLMALLFMGLIAGALRPDVAPTASLALISVLFVGGLVAAWLVSRSWWARWSEGSGLPARLIRWVRLPAIAASVRVYTAPVLARALFVSFIFNFVQIGWTVAIAHGLGLQLPVPLFFVFVPLTATALLVPSLGGLGVRELTTVALLGSVGVPQASALALSLCVYAITVVTGLIGGILYLIQGLRRTAARGEAEHGA